jgi:plastocyanin
VTAAVAVVALAGCGGGSSSPKAPGGTGATGSTITIKDFAFSPTPLTVTPGQEVTVTNKDSATHTITSGDGTSFDSKDLGTNASFTFKAPTRPGTYTYLCNIHQYMKGSLQVS